MKHRVLGKALTDWLLNFPTTWEKGTGLRKSSCKTVHGVRCGHDAANQLTRCVLKQHFLFSRTLIVSRHKTGSLSFSIIQIFSVFFPGLGKRSRLMPTTKLGFGEPAHGKFHTGCVKCWVPGQVNRMMSSRRNISVSGTSASCAQREAPKFLVTSRANGSPHKTGLH